MADNYTEFSESLSIESQTEEEWVRAALTTGPASWLPDPDDDDDLGFEWEFQGELGRREDSRRLCLYSVEHGSAYNAALFVQAFLRRFRPDRSFALSYAETCSKPRVGAFGGGALFVTAGEIRGISTVEWLDQQVTRFQQESA
jgi:hypothetical protein